MNKVLLTVRGTALIDRTPTTSPTPYLVAYGFNPKSGTWAAGEYFTHLEDAIKHFASVI